MSRYSGRGCASLTQVIQHGPISLTTNASAQSGPQVADLEEILEERDACGVRMDAGSSILSLHNLIWFQHWLYRM